MWTFPVILDSRPGYLSPTAGGSLLLAPLGAGTVLSEMCARLGAVCGTPPLVAPAFPTDDAYERAIKTTRPDVEGVEPLARLQERFRSFDPADRLLLADPRCFPLDPADGAFREFGREDDPCPMRHLIALQVGGGGAREWVDADASGRVRGIQRYYDSVSWPYASGVAWTLLPIACLRTSTELPLGSLHRLRHGLAAQCVPSHDVPLKQGGLNLASERGLLALNERRVVAVAANLGGPAGARLLVRADSSVRIDASASVLGPVIAQEGAVVEKGATVIGPAVLGARCRVGAGAMVAQCVIGADQSVPPSTMLRHRAFFGEVRAGAPAGEQATSGSTGPLPVDVHPTTAVGAEALAPSGYPRVKRGIDIVASAAGLILLSPLWLVIAAVLKLDSRGPVFFGHRREASPGGRSFRCWKFRTMRLGADVQQQRLRQANEIDGPQFKMDRDPRRTRVGRVLSATNLDELPQLWNVLVGEMSLVGPRPSPFRENQLCVPWRDGRLRVRPGVTGLWQICRHDRHRGDFHQWIYYDLLYVRNLSLGLDLRILLLTVVSLVRSGNVPLSWLLPSSRDASGGAA